MLAKAFQIPSADSEAAKFKCILFCILNKLHSTLLYRSITKAFLSNMPNPVSLNGAELIVTPERVTHTPRCTAHRRYALFLCYFILRFFTFILYFCALHNDFLIIYLYFQLGSLRLGSDALTCRLWARSLGKSAQKDHIRHTSW